MVQINFKRGNFGYYSFRAREHAGDSLVCAACSALGMALVGALKEIRNLQLKTNCSSGYIDIDIDPFIDEQKQNDVDIVFETIFIGLKQIETTCPDKVNVNVES